ncbi:hypothetical protein ACFTS5_27440 [Nocardia sp. NPDC056952]|uniref:hypothetical protein n=1 Tax=Nocardia sp. NPDC056952 TaxID=3345979 RepID=UPI003629EA62
MVAKLTHGTPVVAEFRQHPYGEFVVTGFAIAAPMGIFVVGGWFVTQPGSTLPAERLIALRRLADTAVASAPAPVIRWPDTDGD